MNEMYWVAYVGFFLLPFCSVCFLIYLEERKQRALVLVNVLVAQVVPEKDEEHLPSAPELADIEATAEKNERPPPPAYAPTSLYPAIHPAIPARMQMPRIYIHAVGLR